jgi:hypothetical protein
MRSTLFWDVIRHLAVTTQCCITSQKSVLLTYASTDSFLTITHLQFCGRINCTLCLIPMQSGLCASCLAMNCRDLYARLSRKCCFLMYSVYIIISRGMVMNGTSVTIPTCTSLICITVESIREINVRKLQSGVVLNSHTSQKIMNISIRWKSEYFSY